MKLYGDYHTHTIYSHGKGTVRQNVERARELGLKQIAITDHGLNHIICGLRWWKVEKIIKEVNELRQEYKDIDILVGVESNLIGSNGQIDLTAEQIKYFDIILCGFHLPAKPATLKDFCGMYRKPYLHMKMNEKDKIRSTSAYVQAIEKYPIDIVTHLNQRIQVNCKDVAKACEKYGTYVELATRHQTLCDKDYEDLLSTNCRFIIDTDAHKIETIGDTNDIEDIIKKYQIPLDRIDNINGNTPNFRSQRKK